MPVSYNRRRFVALLALFGAAPVKAFGQFASEPPPPPTPRLDAIDIKDIGSWHIVSQYSQSRAEIPAERLRVASVQTDDAVPVGGGAALTMEYWRKVDEKPPIEAALTVRQYAPMGTSSFATRVIADGREVATFNASGKTSFDLREWFGPDLAAFAAVANLQVLMTIGDDERVVYDVDLSGTANALAAMPVVADYNYAYRMSRPNTGFSDTTSTPSGSCFLTTACCGVVGLADDCPELATLRSFRDRVMLATPEGRAHVARYYAVAPAILAEMQRRGDERVLLTLYFTTILPAVAAARLGFNGLARGIYTAMMVRLERRYARG
jgi:hypothetical protein